jgi:hypothetical protein
MISVKALCAVPFNCAVDLQWDWHTFPLQITTILCHITINCNFPAHFSHSVVCMKPSLQGLSWFNTKWPVAAYAYSISLSSVLLEPDRGTE